MTQASLLRRCILKAARQSPKCVTFSQTRLCSAQVLHTHSLNVPSFGGSVWIKSPYKVHVQPTNTMDYPNLDQAFVKVNNCLHSTLFNFLCSQHSTTGKLFDKPIIKIA